MKKTYPGGEMRGKRVLTYTVFPYVLTRLMKEANITLRELSEGTEALGHCIPKSSAHGFMCGVIPESPDVFIVFRKYFELKLGRSFTTDDLLYGKNEDHEAMKAKIAQLEQRVKEQDKQLALFEIAERMR